jgi:pimeloyl-ACP methyl ester carboxylesterase
MNIARLACLLGIVLLAGCGIATNDRFSTPDRQANGLVVILPGIEGESYLNHAIRQGLMDAGIRDSMPIYCWGRPVPLAGVLLNQVDFLGNRIEASKISQMIVKYQDENPGKPVYLVGHSGGGGIAVFAAEGMPEGRQVDGLVLLSASIGSGYDLTKALSHCRCGIVNYYNKDDIALLGVGTTIVGNVDGSRGLAAGLIGFDKPNSYDSPSDDKQAHKNARLYQVRVESYMIGDSDAHTGVADESFVRRYVAPWVRGGSWPATTGLAAR